MTSPRGRRCQLSSHQLRQTPPIDGVLGQLRSAATSDGVELRLPVVVGNAPLGRNPTPLLQVHQRGVDRSLVQQHLVAADLLKTPRDAVTM
jgi:hypothetical protein